MAGKQRPKFPFLVPKMGPKYHISLITARNAPKLVKTIYEWISVNNHDMLVPFTCKDIKMAGSQGPKSPFLVPKMGPKYHISLITAEKRSKTSQNPI